MTVEIQGLGKITARKEVLNTIRDWAFTATDVYKFHEHFALADRTRNAANTILDALDNEGYYDRLK